MNTYTYIPAHRYRKQFIESRPKLKRFFKSVLDSAGINILNQMNDFRFIESTESKLYSIHCLFANHLQNEKLLIKVLETELKISVEFKNNEIVIIDK